ncbi:AcrR family transcriptional regulator [Saccharomonospora amisosensis]|uniref:AcrR family transcriptional regulator n=1 Tax=Saccharomonospora amisosensis TaxID=1128677 RepID=A0A7X5ZP39_9PSEU|nr:TetR/AcrR family transcriptional regulator [Saccharomonospora amisosensis]NIJ10403.1 AcrR family transcriptional regulator [Saccharomonospora amisosensis]
MASGSEPKGSGNRRRGASRRTPAPHERQRDPERTKERILASAVEVFSAKGFAGARVSEIASRAGVNQQLIAYYFDSKEGLYRAVGRRWRAYEAQAFPDELDFPELVRNYVRASVDPKLNGRLLAWEGLADSGSDVDDDEARERDARLRREVESIRQRQRAGELDDRFDPAALLLIGMSAANALAVYPQLARGIFGADGSSPELVQHYADQLAQLFGRLSKES